MKFILAIALLTLVALPVLSDTTWPTNQQVQRNGPTVLQSAATTGNGTVLDMNNVAKESIFVVTWGAGTSAGVITLEMSDDATYTGTWAPMAVVTWVSASTKIGVSVTGSLRYVRARISTTVVGGTVGVTVSGTY